MVKMIEENEIIQFAINGGGLALALWLLSRKIDDLRSDMKEINMSLREIILKVIDR
jgi:hypothetical protein